MNRFLLALVQVLDLVETTFDWISAWFTTQNTEGTGGFYDRIRKTQKIAMNSLGEQLDDAIVSCASPVDKVNSFSRLYVIAAPVSVCSFRAGAQILEVSVCSTQSTARVTITAGAETIGIPLSPADTYGWTVSGGFGTPRCFKGTYAGGGFNDASSLSINAALGTILDIQVTYIQEDTLSAAVVGLV